MFKHGDTYCYFITLTHTHKSSHRLPLCRSQPVALTLGFVFMAGAPQLLNLQLRQVCRRMEATEEVINSALRLQVKWRVELLSSVDVIDCNCVCVCACVFRFVCVLAAVNCTKQKKTNYFDGFSLHAECQGTVTTLPSSGHRVQGLHVMRFHQLAFTKLQGSHLFSRVCARN